MKIPDNMTEQEVIDIIEKIASNIAWKFVFANYTYEDIKQEAFIWGIKGLDKYNPEQPLENFLWVHIKNRLCNLKRKKYTRIDKPCLTCPLKAYVKNKDLCTAFDTKADCKLYASWQARNEKKKNIIMPVNIGLVSDADSSLTISAVDTFIYSETVDLIDKNISIEVRPIWLKVRGGIKLLKEEREMLQDEVRQILRENNVEENW